MKGRLAYGLILVYLLGFGLLYMSTVVRVGGDIAGLRATHLDIPAWASDTVFQAKNLAGLAIGLALIIGGAGLLVRWRWGGLVAKAGLTGQVVMYIAELALFGLVIFDYRPTLGMALVVPISTAIVYYLTRKDRSERALAAHAKLGG